MAVFSPPAQGLPRAGRWIGAIRTVLWSCCIAGLLQAALSEPARAQAPAAASTDVEPLILAVVLDGARLSDGVLALRHRSDIRLPLGEMARLLSLAIEVDPFNGRASGFVVKEDRPFHLDVGQAVVHVAGAQKHFEAHRVQVHGGDLMVSSRLIERWLPLDLDIRLDQMLVIVRPRERLPLQARLERERVARLIASPGSLLDPRAEPLPLLRSDPAWLSTPALDLTLGVQAQSGAASRRVEGAYAAFMTADVLGLEGAAYVGQAAGQAGAQWRLTLGRRDPDAQLLGPLRARSAQAGQVQLPGVTHVMGGSGPGTGLIVSNRPLNFSASYDRQTLRGDLPPGWDVTLYYNDALVGFQSAGPDGQYVFEDLPLSFGRNDFVLVFNGPLGQLRTERRSFSLDQGAARPGELLYDLAHHQADAGGRRTVAGIDLGLSSGWVASAGWLASPTRPRGIDGIRVQHEYARTGLRRYGDRAIVSAEWVRQNDGANLVDLGLKTRLEGYAIDLQHVRVGRGFDSEILASGAGLVRQRDRIRIQGAWAASPTTRFPVAIDAQRDRLESGDTSTSVGARVSAFAAGVALTQSLAWRQASGTSSLTGEFQASRRLMDMGVTGRLGFSLRPQQRLETLALTADRIRAGGVRQSAGLSRDMTSGVTQVTLGLARSLGAFSLAANASYSSRREVALGMQLFIALAREPRTGRWFTDALPLAGAGAVSVLAFLDRNFNGVRDEGEEPVPNAGFIIDGSGRLPLRTGDDGIALITRLAPGRYLNLALDAGTLEDPMWKPGRPGVRVLPRPGVVQGVELPVVSSADIDGTVWLIEGERRLPLAHTRVELLDDRGQVVAQTHSADDGFYLLPQVLPGRYLLRLAAQVGANAAPLPPATRALEVRVADDFINGIDLEVRRAPR